MDETGSVKVTFIVSGSYWSISSKSSVNLEFARQGIVSLHSLAADTQQWLSAGLEDESFCHLLLTCTHTHDTAFPALFLFATFSCSISCSLCFWMHHWASSVCFQAFPSSKSFPNEVVFTVVPFLDIFCSPYLFGEQGRKKPVFWAHFTLAILICLFTNNTAPCTF